MPRKSKSLDEDQIKMRKVMVDRLNELIDKAGGKKKFIDKINKIRTGGDQTDHKSLTAWLDPAKKITIYNIYLIAKAHHVSADWLLGLNNIKIRNGEGFISPSTYGDVLTFLDNLFQKGIAAIIDGTDMPWALDEDLYTTDGPVQPKFFQIKDEHLRGLIQNQICIKRELNDNNFNIAWKDILKSEKTNPLPDNQDYNREQPNQSKESEQPADIPKKAVDLNNFKTDTSGRLKKMMVKNLIGNKISYRQLKTTLKTSESVVHAWANKGNMPDIFNLCLIAKTYKKTADWILGLDKIEDRIKFYENEGSTYGSALYILNYLMENQTIGFVDDLTGLPSDPDVLNAPKIDGRYIIYDDFLVCLLLRLETLKRHPGNEMNQEIENLFYKYKETNLLPFNENMILASHKIVCELRNDGHYQNIDLDKLYERLQALQ